jgi:hypothetical protein
MSDHRQAHLPDLGLSVDSDLEDLTRAAWHSGISTHESCIDPPGGGDETGYVSFVDPAAGTRWKELVPPSLGFVLRTEGRGATTAGRFVFRRADLPAIVEVLRRRADCPR